MPFQLPRSPGSHENQGQVLDPSLVVRFQFQPNAILQHLTLWKIQMVAIRNSAGQYLGQWINSA